MPYYSLLAFSIFSPVNPFTDYAIHLSDSNSIISMVPPPGGGISRENENNDSHADSSNVLNETTKPGCTMETNEHYYPDGSSEIRQTLRCVRITVDRDGHITQQKPAEGSKLDQHDAKMIKEFMASRKSGHSKR